MLLCVFSAGDHQGFPHALLLSNIPSPLCFSLHGHMCLCEFTCALEWANAYSCAKHVRVYLPMCMCEHSYVPEHLCVVVCVHTYLPVPMHTCVFWCNKVSDLQRWPGSSSVSFPGCCQMGETELQSRFGTPESMEKRGSPLSLFLFWL